MKNCVLIFYVTIEKNLKYLCKEQNIRKKKESRRYNKSLVCCFRNMILENCILYLGRGLRYTTQYEVSNRTYPLPLNYNSVHPAPWIHPVSYTHLDVYKRQLYIVISCRPMRNQCTDYAQRYRYLV